MAAKTDPFANFDFAKIMAEYKIPGLDADALVASQQKNFEAISAANKASAEGLRAIAERQQAILKEILEDSASTMQEMMAAGAPEDKVARQTEVCKSAFEKAVANMKEISDLVANSNSEAMDIINGRIAESLDEVQSILKPAKK